MLVVVASAVAANVVVVVVTVVAVSTRTGLLVGATQGFKVIISE